MKTEAQKILENMVSNGLLRLNSNEILEAQNNNEECCTYLQDVSTCEKEILGQDTYIFSDNSYITRLQDDYFDGLNVSMFEIEEELN